MENKAAKRINWRFASVKQGTILRKLLIGISLLFLATMTATGIIINLQANSLLTDQATELLRQTTQATRQAIDEKARNIVSTLLTFAAVSKASELNGSQTFDIFAEIAANEPTITGLQLATPDGRYFSYPGSPTDSSYDPRQTDWYQGAVKAKGPYISDVFQYSPTEFPKIAISLPLLDEAGSADGVVVAFASVYQLSDLVDSIRLGESGYAFLVDHQGNLLAHPDKRLALTRPSMRENPVVQQVIGGNSGIGSFAGENARYVSAYLYDSELRWGIVVAQTESEIRQNAAKIKKIISSITIISLVAIIVALYFYVRRIVQPIKEVQAKMTRFGEGDLTQTIQLSTNDETQLLGSSFNLMTETLRQIIMKISQVTSGVKEIAGRVSSGSEHSKVLQADVAKQMEVLAAEMEEENRQVQQMQAAVDQIAAELETIHAEMDVASLRSDEVRQQARQAAQTVDALQADAGNIIEDMQSSHRAFAELQESVEDILKILVWIRDISKRTKLLSLNARIEASRAGQAGLGFGVVADEIHQLSVQTETATRDISELLQQASDKLEAVESHLMKTDGTAQNSMKTLGATAGIFRNITEQIASVNEHFSAVHHSAAAIKKRSQALQTGIRQLSASVHHVVAGMQQAVAGAQESAGISEAFFAQSEELIRLVDGLGREVDYFRTKP
ncbi:methyl-accepting chemotaxis protein [Brevibacillus massiliensis]|uniref:methyl-accepting chemotaxis protein n=1 Tax=Brevibacillus massiliensis TaxID=1118054 RepID=UPI0002DD4C62|nr:methyl-accepting chemotaxis protein [Brevibacillus massiliensis]